MSSVIQRALSGGELDPVLWARSDVTKYMTGARTIRNFLIRRNGGVQGKPGASVCAPVVIGAGNPTSRLIPFIYSQTVSYALEFCGSNAGFLRFYQNGKPYLAQGATAYSNATNYKAGDLVTSGGVTYICIWGMFVADPRLTGGSLATQINHTPPNSTYWYPLTNGVYEIPIPLPYQPNLFIMKYDQTANDVVFTHPLCSQMRLTRWVDTNGHDVFGWFNVQMGSYMGSANPTNDQGDSNTPTIAAAATVYAVSAANAAGDERAQFILGDGTNASVKGVDLTTTNSVPSSGAPIQINWSAVTGAISYNIYYRNKKTGVFGFLGSTSFLTFQDNGITPDYANPWVQKSNTLSNAYGVDDNSGNCPSAVAFHQQRLFYGNTNNLPTTCWGTETGLYDNMNIHVPSLATDALSFKMAGAQDIVQHLLSLNALLVFTYGSVNSINGDQTGAISPAAINPHRESIRGASSLKPLIVGEFALYTQAQGSIIRDLGFNFQVDGYKGDDLTVFATHLFDNYTMIDWAYQQTPHSIVWVVRSDGTLLSLTYLREQQVLGWAHHDTLGTYESVCCIPEGNQNSVYVVTKRTINGSTARFVERFFNQQYSPTLQFAPNFFASPVFSDIRDYIAMDCATTIDGRNSSAFTESMTLSGGTLWNETELLTLTVSGNHFLTFTNAMATNQDMIFLYDASGNLYRFKITARSSNTVVQGFLDRSVPVSLQGGATTFWSYARSIITGLSYLEGQNVSVFADGCVVGSPNNAAYPVYTVTGGQITLDKPYAVIQIGLPFISDIETLDIDTPGPQDNMGDRFKMVGEVTIYMVNSRSVWVGGISPDLDPANTSKDPLYRLTEQKLRQNETYDNPMALQTGKVTQTIQPDWDSNGHVFIRNVDPTPVLVSAISPDGLFPGRVG